MIISKWLDYGHFFFISSQIYIFHYEAYIIIIQYGYKISMNCFEKEVNCHCGKMLVLGQTVESLCGKLHTALLRLFIGCQASFFPYCIPSAEEEE